MPFTLPPVNHPARELMGDLAHVVDVLAPANVSKLVTFEDAVRQGRKTVAGNPAIKRVVLICLRADDARWLISVGRRGGWRKEWDFSKC